MIKIKATTLFSFDEEGKDIKPEFMSKYIQSLYNYFDYRIKQTPNLTQETNIEIYEPKIWETSFCLDDVLGVMDEEETEIWNSLSDEKKKEIFDEHEHSIKKGLEGGLMYDWEIVMQSASEEFRSAIRNIKIRIL
jgi:hypothetical protein